MPHQKLWNAASPLPCLYVKRFASTAGFMMSFHLNSQITQVRRHTATHTPVVVSFRGAVGPHKAVCERRASVVAHNTAGLVGGRRDVSPVGSFGGRQLWASTSRVGTCDLCDGQAAPPWPRAAANTLWKAIRPPPPATAAAAAAARSQPRHVARIWPGGGGGRRFPGAQGNPYPKLKGPRIWPTVFREEH